MRTFIFIVTFLLVTFLSFAQNQADGDASDVFSFLIQDKRNVFLLPRFDTAVFNTIQSVLSKKQYIRRVTIDGKLNIDTINFSDNERLYIEKSLLSLKAYSWTSKNIKENGLSHFTLIDTTKAVRKNDFDYVIYQIMKPIFLRNNSICLVYYEYACGGLCGHGELSILIKKDGKWNYWENIFSFDS
jgi:hypothetical protein